MISTLFPCHLDMLYRNHVLIVPKVNNWLWLSQPVSDSSFANYEAELLDPKFVAWKLLINLLNYRLHCWCILCHCFTSSRYRGIEIESSERCIGHGCGQEIGLGRFMGWFSTTYCYDWYIDSRTMVHLWCCQGCIENATATTSRNARVTQKEARRSIRTSPAVFFSQ